VKKKKVSMRGPLRFLYNGYCKSEPEREKEGLGKEIQVV